MDEGYIPVPSKAVADICKKYQKDMAIVITWDFKKNKLNVATFANEPKLKKTVAAIGARVPEFLGITSPERIVYEDLPV